MDCHGGWGARVSSFTFSPLDDNKSKLNTQKNNKPKLNVSLVDMGKKKTRKNKIYLEIEIENTIDVTSKMCYMPFFPRRGAVDSEMSSSACLQVLNQS